MVGTKDLEERLARVEAELQFLKYQNRLKNDSLLARMARRWARLDYLNVGWTTPQLNVLGSDAGTQLEGSMYPFHNSADATDQLNISFNLKKSGNTQKTINDSYAGWAMNGFGGIGDQITWQRNPGGGSLIDIVYLTSAGTFSLRLNGAGILGTLANGTTHDVPMVYIDSSNQLQISNTANITYMWLNSIPKFVAANSTGAVTNTLGALGPNTVTTPYTWVKCLSSDGTTCYFPIWK